MYSSIDSREVAQNLDSPLIGGFRQWIRVSAMDSACGELGSIRRVWRTEGRRGRENGRVSDTDLGRNFGVLLGFLIGKKEGIEFPSFKSF